MNYFRREEAHSVEQMAVEIKKELKQLQREIQIERTCTSETLRDLLRYVEENRINDPLLNGSMTMDKNNPFAPKSKFRCNIL